MLKTGEVNIRKYSSDRYRWVASFLSEGDQKRARRYFKTRKDAEDFAEQWREQAVAEGTESPLIPRERAAVLHFRDELAAAGLSLHESIKLGLEQHAKLSHHGDVQTLVQKRLDHMAGERASRDHIISTRARLKKFAERFGTRAVASIEPEEINQFLAGLNVSARTVRNYRAALSAMFSYGVSLGFCGESPITKQTLNPKAPS